MESQEGATVVDAFLSLQAVIFDCDGVLVDTEPLHFQAFQEVLRPLGLGHDYEHYKEYYIGFDDRDAFIEAFREAGRSLSPDTLLRLIESKGQALQRIIAGGLSSFPGVVELVRALVAHRVPLAVASGALRHEIGAFLEVLELKEAFPVIVAADDVSRSKPDPETYLLAMNRLEKNFDLNHLNPRSCVAIEDTPAGIQSAKAAGLYVIGVTNSFPAEQLDAADHVLEHLSQLDFMQLNRLLECAVV